MRAKRCISKHRNHLQDIFLLSFLCDSDYFFIRFSLHRRHQHRFRYDLFMRQSFQVVSLLPSEENRLKLLFQFLSQRFLSSHISLQFLQLVLVGVTEILQIPQTSWLYEIHDTPQIHPCILDRRPCNSDCKIIFHGFHCIRDECHWVFDLLRFIKHHE